MSLWRQLVRGVRALTHRSAADRDVADEVQDYLDRATVAHLARGLSPDAARRAARLDVGGVASVNEQVRGSGWEHAVETLVSDVRYAARGLRAAPGFTAIVVLTLAVGIGGTTAIFGAVHPILFEPLAYPDAGRIMMIWETRGTGERSDGTFGMYRWMVERSQAFEAIAVMKPWQPTLTRVDEPARLAGQRVSASYFHVLGVAPALGRDFLTSDDQPNAPNAVILSDTLWRQTFAADRTIVGRQIVLDDASYTVVGVMAVDFDNALAPTARAWAPLQYDMTQGRAWGHHLRTVGRLRPGVTVAGAARETNALGQAGLTEQRPPTYGRPLEFVTTPLEDDVTRGVKPTLLTILGAVTLVLVIASVNVTNLLLARGVRRRREFALRTALGAGRRRLFRLLLTESLLLAAMGGMAGLAVAWLGVQALVALSPPGLSRVGAIGIDAAVFAFATSLTTLIGLAIGVVPALQAARIDLQHDLRSGSRASAAVSMRGGRRTRGALVVAEVALALVLLVGSGLLFRSLERLFAVETGFDSSRVLTMQVQATGRQFDPPGATMGFFEHALESTRRIPGVTAAALTSQLPLSGDRDEYGARFESSPNEGYNTFRYAVSPGYFETMRIALRRGRLLDERDRAGAPLVAVVSESLARLKFGAPESAIGEHLQIGSSDGPFYAIVGVVGDVKQMSLSLSQSEAVYTPASQWPFPDKAMSLVVRARGDAAALASAVRSAVWSVDKDQPITRVATMDDLLAATATERRFALIVFEAFAIAALLLAAAGIYGVLAGSVAERTREIGVRSALGASRAAIVVLVVRQGLTLTGLGVAIGLAGSMVASQTLVGMLFRVSRLDAATYLGVTALLVAVAAIACVAPAWRAARVDPASTLKAE